MPRGKFTHVFFLFRYYEGRNGWWLYDQRTNDEIDQAFRRADRRVEVLIVGQLYVIDFENMEQFRLNETHRRRRIKYDLISAPKKGVAGLKLDQHRSNPVEPPIVPSLASSVASVVVSSSSDSIRRSRSDADGEEPTLVPPSSTIVDSSRTILRQPADGFGNPNNNRWRTRDEEEDKEDEEDEEDGPPSSRLRPVLIGGEDDRTSTRIPSGDTANLLNKLSLS